MELLILANSRKLGGRCIAGIDLVSKKWVRPVSRTEHGELSKEECLISENGVWRDIEVLDVVSAPIGQPIKSLGQPENCVLLSDAWSLKGKIPISEAEKVLDLVCDDEESLLYGTGRSVDMQSVKSGRVNKSLTLVKVVQPSFCIDESSKKLRCRFKYSSHNYDLPVTDDSGWVSAAKVDPDSFSVGTWFLTVSLGEAYLGQMWKLIAAGISTSRENERLLVSQPEGTLSTKIIYGLAIDDFKAPIERDKFSHYRADGLPKKSFATRVLAQQAIAHLLSKANSDEEYNVYKCGNHFHIGHARN